MNYLGDGDRLSGEHRLVDDAAALDEDSVALHDEASEAKKHLFLNLGSGYGKQVERTPP